MNSAENEQLQSIEEVLQALVQKISSFEKLTTENQLSDSPDYSQLFDSINTRLEELKEANTRNQGIEQLNRLISITSKIPNEIPVKHHHHFEKTPKGFVIGIFSLLLITAFSSGLAFYFNSLNNQSADNSWKFRMVRQINPVTAHYADSLYNLNPDRARNKTKELEEMTMKRKEAEIIASEKEKEALKARNQVNQIK